VALKTYRKSPVVPVSPSTDITPRLLTVKQAAHYVGCTVWHVRELYWSKAVLGFVAGRRLLLDRTSLDQWMTAGSKSVPLCVRGVSLFIP
jgi:excisionase family DNA binding protein